MSKREAAIKKDCFEILNKLELMNSEAAETTCGSKDLNNQLKVALNTINFDLSKLGTMYGTFYNLKNRTSNKAQLLCYENKLTDYKDLYEQLIQLKKIVSDKIQNLHQACAN